MGKILDNNVEVDDIVYWFDADNKAVDKVIDAWGQYVPVIKVGNTTLSYSDIISFRLSVQLNDIVHFNLTLNDQLFKIREYLVNDIDTGVIRIGYRNWALKFNCVFDTTKSSPGSMNINLKGSIYDERLYNSSEQKVYNNMSIQDILLDVCQSTGLGLYVHENDSLTNEVHEKIINYGLTPLDFINYLITNFTDNVWVIDPNYYLHVGNIDDTRLEDVAMYSLDWKDGTSLYDRELTFIKKSKNLESQEDPLDAKIPVRFYDTTTNYTSIFKDSRHFVVCTEDDVIDLKQKPMNETIEFSNTFSGFKSHKTPFYDDIINKYLGGNLIELYVEHLIIEMNPLDVANLELYNAAHEGHSILDSVHSGKKVVIGYTLDYSKSNDAAVSRINQRVFCI